MDFLSNLFGWKCLTFAHLRIMKIYHHLHFVHKCWTEFQKELQGWKLTECLNKWHLFWGRWRIYPLNTECSILNFLEQLCTVAEAVLRHVGAYTPFYFKSEKRFRSIKRYFLIRYPIHRTISYLLVHLN